MTFSRMLQIKASAGSGKTYDLTKRFLHLLAQTKVEPHTPVCHSFATQNNTAGWGDILATTFTNCAATEMKERILQSLKSIALGITKQEGISSALATTWVNTILRQYGALNIRTIDSLIHLIVRTAALNLQLPPDFETSFTTEETLDPLFEAILEQAEYGETNTTQQLQAICRAMVFHKDVTGFTIGKRLLQTLIPIVKYVFSQRHVDFSPPKDLEAYKTHLFCQYTDLASALLEQADKEKLCIDKKARQIFTLCAQGDSTKTNSAYLSKEHISACLTSKSPQASDTVQHIYAKLTQAAIKLENEGHILRKALILCPFIELATTLATQLEHFQQTEGKIPADRIPLLAQDILSLEYGVPDALCRLGSSMQHILLDEFQDTNHEQWDTLRPLIAEALSRGGSLTWVGDVKQAIYSWRGGDAELFDDVLRTRELTNIATDISTENLPINWRSHEAIVRTNNALFAPLGQVSVAQSVLEAMLSAKCPAHILQKASTLLSTSFAQATQQTRPCSATNKNSQHIESGFVTIQEVTGINTQELTEAVQETLHTCLMNLSTRRSWEDVTILVRSNNAASTVAQWLMEWNIPVITENSLCLAAHPLIKESIALCNFLNCPQDDLSFWTVITGNMLAPHITEKHPHAPTLPELHQWALQQSKSMWSMAFKKQWPLFWEQWIAPFYNKGSLMSPYDTIQEWYRILEVPQRFPEAQTFLRRFLEIIHSNSEHGAATLSTFLDIWHKNSATEKVPMPSHMNAVRIMTIHKSKGLQFPVVIIPWTSFNYGEQQNSSNIPYEINNLRVLAPLCKQMGDVYYEAQAQKALETLNLLYVTCTRAEEELHIFHTHTPKLLKMHQNLACGLDILLPTAQLSAPFTAGQIPLTTCKTVPDISSAQEQDKNNQRDTIHTESTTEAPTTSAKLQTTQDIPTWQKQWPMQWMPRLKIYRNPLQELRFTPRQRGILTHTCLECLQNTGNIKNDVEKAVRLGLQSSPLPIPHSEELYTALLQSLTWYAELPGVNTWIHYGLPEQNMLDAKGKVHRADVLLPPHNHKYGAKNWRVIDYKTGQDEKEHLNQIRRYLTLLNDLPTQEVRPSAEGMLVYLDLRKCRMVQINSHSELLSAPQWSK